MELPNEPKIYTVEEANQLLPWLTTMLKELMVKKKQIEDKQAEIDALELISDENTPKVRTELLAQSAKFNEWVNQFNEKVKKLDDKGCQLKDMDMGLVDFYGIIDGKMVFLCWKLGEPQVSYWHDIGSGYIHRKPIGTLKERDRNG